MSALGPELDDAVNAARGDDLGSGGLADATRERVLASLQQRGQRQRTMAAFATVLALSLLGTTSWAWVSGWLPATIDRLRGEAPARVPDVPDVPKGPKGHEGPKGPKGQEIAVAQGGGPPLRPRPPELVLPELAPASEPAPTATRP
ncbi:MAG: hypothetical protein IPI49_00100 [Myxococcales bacterium]|nr:hypothetical protein [Myxococcales bacterium]